MISPFPFGDHMDATDKEKADEYIRNTIGKARYNPDVVNVTGFQKNPDVITRLCTSLLESPLVLSSIKE